MVLAVDRDCLTQNELGETLLHDVVTVYITKAEVATVSTQELGEAILTLLEAEDG